MFKLNRFSRIALTIIFLSQAAFGVSPNPSNADLKAMVQSTPVFMSREDHNLLSEMSKLLKYISMTFTDVEKHFEPGNDVRIILEKTALLAQWAGTMGAPAGIALGFKSPKIEDWDWYTLKHGRGYSGEAPSKELLEQHFKYKLMTRTAVLTVAASVLSVVASKAYLYYSAPNREFFEETKTSIVKVEGAMVTALATCQENQPDELENCKLLRKLSTAISGLKADAQRLSQDPLTISLFFKKLSFIVDHIAGIGLGGLQLLSLRVGGHTGPGVFLVAGGVLVLSTLTTNLMTTLAISSASERKVILSKMNKINARALEFSHEIDRELRRVTVK